MKDKRIWRSNLLFFWEHPWERRVNVRLRRQPRYRGLVYRYRGYPRIFGPRQLELPTTRALWIQEASNGG